MLATLYDWLLLVHILAAMVWVGSVTVLGVQAGSVVGRRDAVEIGRFTQTLRRVGPTLMAPASIAVLVLGVWMVLDAAAWDFEQTWVWLAIVLFALAFVIGAVFQSRSALAAEPASSGDHDTAVPSSDAGSGGCERSWPCWSSSPGTWSSSPGSEAGRRPAPRCGGYHRRVMAHRFELPQDAVVGASPERVWDAIATGPGWDSWFMGRNEIEQREGGSVSFSIGDWTGRSTVQTWDPLHRFVSESSPAPDGSFHRFDYALESRPGGGTQVTYVHSGMLGDDWEAEYEGMSEGDPMYFRKLLEYIEHFPGRYATPVDAQGPNVGDDRDAAMATCRRALGVPDDVAEGDRVTLRPEGLEPIDGVVDVVSPSFLGVRSDDAMYRFIRGFEGAMMVGHHLFEDGVDQQREESAWRDWLGRVFAP
jgi:uncharacterized protein YndB with AHSA1/START domain/uncharacterized membrane protein